MFPCAHRIATADIPEIPAGTIGQRWIQGRVQCRLRPRPGGLQERPHERFDENPTHQRHSRVISQHGSHPSAFLSVHSLGQVTIENAHVPHQLRVHDARMHSVHGHTAAGQPLRQLPTEQDIRQLALVVGGRLVVRLTQI